MKNWFALIVPMCILVSLHAQDEQLQKEGGFKKENLFTGGSVSLGFGSNSFQAGGSPMLGYSVARWIDAGITLNYNYASYSNVNVSNPNDKLRLSTYGAGAFTRIYPISIAFVQAQYEHNFISQKLLYGDGGAAAKSRQEANSLLLGAGYSSNRYPGSGQPFFYLSLMFDVLANEFSPYVGNTGNIIPILRGGIQVPLFQGKRRMPEY